MERDEEMRIRLHNSLLKIRYDPDPLEFFQFLFDEKVFLSLYNNHIHIGYEIDDKNYFLSFSAETKEFVEWLGFGKDTKEYNSAWRRDFKWREMEKEDEDQGT